jgi:multiple sugar transport system permease protein
MIEQLSSGIPQMPTLKTYRSLSSIGKREMKWGLIFLSPWLLGFIVFTFLPLIASLIFSFLDIRITDGILTSPDFIGLDNYETMFSDSQIWATESATLGSLWITVRFGIIALPVGIIVPLVLAMLVNSPHLRGKGFFRSMFYMPYIIPFVAAIFLWGGMLNPETGWINRTLMWMGLPRESVPGWANDIDWVYPAYVILGIWGIGNAFLIFLAGLQGVPTELYDAAKVDGANGWQQFWKITFPMISPVVFYNVTLSIVGLFQYFLVPLVVNNGTGRPGGATNFFNLYLYKTFFTFQRMGYGSAMAWLLFGIILLVTLVLFGTAKYWVFYAGGDRND